ncbi:Atrial natriuretic peptide receptor 1 [Hypsibius exemplaris]|uniref:guanylate cyclase n=1 Tax=Hypsibius exemplaris TaxID=2072580 RepID=A0A1W0WCJ5_HYPEX|nr:Atrial natriuretic peptide receptor 1 [Hypsibius exemplaris]
MFSCCTFGLALFFISIPIWGPVVVGGSVIYPELISTIPFGVHVGVALPATGAGLDIAQTAVNSRFAEDLNLTVSLVYNKNDTICDDSDEAAAGLAAEYYQTRSFNRCAAFTNSGCGGLITMPFLARELDLLLFAINIVPGNVYNPFVAPTSIGMAGSMDDAGGAVLDLLLYFKWFHVTIISAFSNGVEVYDFFYYTIQALLGHRPDRYGALQIERTQFDPADEESQIKALRLASDRSRVFFMFTGTAKVIEILRLMKKIGLFVPGSYVFIVMQATQQNVYGPPSLLNLPKKDDEDLFRSVIFLHTVSPAGQDLSVWNLQYAQRSMALYGSSTEKGIDPLDLPSNRATFNTVYLFSTLVREAKAADPAGTLTDAQLCSASRLKSLMVNRTFQFPSGSFYIDPHGLGHTDLVLLMSNHETGLHERVGRYDSVQQIFVWNANDTLKWVGNGPPLDEPACGYSGFEGICKDQARATLTTAVAAAVAAVAVIVLIIGVIFIRREKSQQQFWNRPWIANLEDMEPLATPEGKLSFILPEKSSSSIENGGHWMYRGRDVWVVKVKLSPKTQFTDPRIVVLGDMMHGCYNNNIEKFLGLIAIPNTPSLFILEAFGERGSLRDLLNEGIISREFQKSFVQDLIQGLHYIHTSKFRKHGKLSSLCCIIDKHFVVKISKLGHEQLMELNAPNRTEPLAFEFSIWNAPEQQTGRSMPDAKSDIYALGVILFEVFTNNSLLEMLSRQNESPLVKWFESVLTHGQTSTLILNCCNEDPLERPTIHTVQKDIFTELQIRAQDNLMSRTLARLAAHAHDLEAKVGERTRDLVEQRRLCDLLLEEMLPRLIVERLRANLDVTPRMFDSVTVYFSDIDGFGDFALVNSPYDVISFLNQVYSTLDVLIAKFDVYKVETINDSYVVVSGIPIPNGQKHAAAVAFMSLAFMKAYSESDFRRQTRLRAGMHSGPIAAGVVGQRSPRYCLFGDTMNTASRMESHGEPGRIHVSPRTAELLQDEPDLRLTPRGVVNIKGKGQIETFWLATD